MTERVSELSLQAFTHGDAASREAFSRDLMAGLQRLTNGVIPATTHRVVNPEGPNVSRYSMPFFMHPTLETSLEALPSCVGEGGVK